MALNEQHPGLLWEISLSASFCVSFLCMQCGEVCSAPDLFWLSSATSLNDASPKHFDGFGYFFLAVIACCHSLFRDVSEFPLDFKYVFREFYLMKSG